MIIYDLLVPMAPTGCLLGDHWPLPPDWLLITLARFISTKNKKEQPVKQE